MFTYNFDSFSITILHEKIENSNSDVILNWIYPTLKSGNHSCANILNKAGTQVKAQLMLIRSSVYNYGDCFSTLPGFLKSNVLLHSIMTPYKEKYNESFFKIKETLLTYSKDNLCRSISLSFPINDYDTCINFILEYFPKVTSIKKIMLYVNSDQELQELRNVLYKKNKKESWLFRFLRLFKK